MTSSPWTRLTVSETGSAGTAPSQPSPSAVSTRSRTSSGSNGRAATRTAQVLKGRTALNRRADLRLDRALLPVRAHAGEDVLQPGGGLILVHLLRVHELAGEDLLRLHEHLLLTGREALLVIAQREVHHDLGELEDVAGLHLVAVVLEAAVPVLRHLRAGALEGLQHLLDHHFVDDAAKSDRLGVLARNVDGHVVVEDLDREVFALLA